jgi:hypothetical protein
MKGKVRLDTLALFSIACSVSLRLIAGARGCVHYNTSDYLDASLALLL